MKFFVLIVSTLIVSTFSSITASSNKQANFRHKEFENSLRPKILLKGQENEKMNLCERMRHLKIPGMSVAVVNDGKIEQVNGYGHTTDSQNGQAINEHTRFQAGSISKPLAAFGALLLVQRGKLSLDEDVNRYLRRWKIPENEFTTTEKVTLRRLLSHTAGVNISGFSGYLPHDKIPTTVDILEGKKPVVNTDPVRVVAIPGTKWEYSGGGYTIVQQLIEDITQESFDVWMQKNVLNPLGMCNSTFTQPSTSQGKLKLTMGHHLSGVPIEGKWHIYPEMAAAGLWSTPHDLSLFLQYIQFSLSGEQKKLLNPSYVEEMVKRQTIASNDIDFGLGFHLQNSGKSLIFSHAGQNEGFISRLMGFAYLDKGLVIMINDDSGWILMEEITNSIADTYNWPGFDPIIKEKITLNPDIYKNLTGEYAKGEEIIVISSKDGKLFMDTRQGLGSIELIPSSACTFFIQLDNFTLTFSDCKEIPESLSLKGPDRTEKVYYKNTHPNSAGS